MYIRRFFFIMFLAVVAVLIALPPRQEYSINLFGSPVSFQFGSPVIDLSVFGRRLYADFEYKKGLDIQGGVQLILEADMTPIEQSDRVSALESAKNIIYRRVDLFGISEPLVRSAIVDESYRILVDLPGAENVEEALSLVGQTAQLQFSLLLQEEASDSASLVTSIEPTTLTGRQLKRATVQFDPQTGVPVVGIEFNQEGAKLFADITTEHTGELLGILIDDSLVMAPRINVPILTGNAVITGEFTAEQAKELAVQLNAGALPVSVTVLEQRTVGASLGAESINKSILAGTIGLALVMVFMLLYYGTKGILAIISLSVYIATTLAVYKILGVTLTLPAITGMLLSTAMAVDATILIFERHKEELRAGRSFAQATSLAFGRAWGSIKDANLATAITALILINPLELSFLNTGGMVRGFGITLLIGIGVGLYTGVLVMRTLMMLFLQDKKLANI